MTFGYGVGVASISSGVGVKASSVGDGVSVDSTVAVGLGSGVLVSGEEVGSGVAVSTGVVAVASGVEGTAVASGDGVPVAVAIGVFVGVAVGVLVGVGVGVFTVELVNGLPPLTVTAFVCACPNDPSPRTDVGPSFTQVGAFTLMLALPVPLVFTCPTWTQDVPFFHRMFTVSYLA
jgi:hypothetical protein